MALRLEKPASEKGFTASVEFAKELVDKNLSALVMAGERIVISDLPVKEERAVSEKNEAEEEVHKGIHR